MLKRILPYSWKLGVRSFLHTEYYTKEQIAKMPDFNKRISDLPLRVKVSYRKVPVNLIQRPYFFII